MTTEQDVFDQFESYRFSDDPEFRVSTASPSPRTSVCCTCSALIHAPI